MEINRDLGFDLHRRAIQKVGPVLPLAHGFDGSLGQHGIATDYLDSSNGTLFADGSKQSHRPVFAQLESHRRILASASELLDSAIAIEGGAGCAADFCISDVPVFVFTISG